MVERYNYCYDPSTSTTTTTSPASNTRNVSRLVIRDQHAFATPTRSDSGDMPHANLAVTKSRPRAKKPVPSNVGRRHETTNIHKQNLLAEHFFYSEDVHDTMCVCVRARAWVCACVRGCARARACVCVCVVYVPQIKQHGTV